MKHKIITCLALLLATTGFVFANGQNENTSKVDEKTNLVFWNSSPEQPNKSLYQYGTDSYNNSADAKFNINTISTQNDAYKEKLIIAMSSGQCPDFYQTWSGGPMYEYIDSGFAQPLEDLVNNSVLPERLMDVALTQGSYNGHIYGIPTINVAISGIYYNKEIFNEYNIEIPTTIAELENACDTLVSNGIIPFALANKTKWTGSMYFMNLVARKGGLKPFDAAVEGQGSFEDPCFIYAGEKIQEWVKKGYFPEGVNSLSDDDGQAKQLLYQNKAAMECMGSWLTSDLKNDSAEFYQKVGWFKFPVIKDSSADPTIQIGSCGQHFISFNCTGEKLEAAFKAIVHLSDPESVESMVQEGKIPPVKNAKDYITDPITKDILEAANNAASIQLWYDQYLPPAVAQTHLNTCQEIFGLTITPQKAASLLEKSMEEYIKTK